MVDLWIVTVSKYVWRPSHQSPSLQGYVVEGKLHVYTAASPTE